MGEAWFQLAHPIPRVPVTTALARTMHSILLSPERRVLCIESTQLLSQSLKFDPNPAFLPKLEGFGVLLQPRLSFQARSGHSLVLVCAALSSAQLLERHREALHAWFASW